MCCRGLQSLANTPYLKGFLCCALPRVAWYGVPGGVRVVSISPMYPRHTVVLSSSLQLKSGKIYPRRSTGEPPFLPYKGQHPIARMPTSRCLHPGLPLAYSAQDTRSASTTNSAHRPADPEDTPGREGDAGQRKARDVQHRLEADPIGRDANVACGRGPAARATATPAAFFCPGSAFCPLARAPNRTRSRRQTAPLPRGRQSRRPP
jgi:hypothetical protein